MNHQSSFQESLLVLIDMQHAFQRPGLQWECDGYDAAANRVQELREAHLGPAVWTQFIRDPAEEDAWGSYYDRWDQYRLGPEDPVWGLTLEPQPEDIRVQAPTFGKWITPLIEVAKPYATITIAGVATDCCVLSTVLPAVDAGKYVTVVSDACAGATPEAHQQALSLMAMLNPMVTIATTAEVLDPLTES